jgi:mannose-6-phosphate isomerase-like protein (cupin superfamily)
MPIDITKAHIYGPTLPKNSTTVDKAWGKEFILPCGDHYSTKIMYINPNARCSLHFHRDKEETFVLVQGVLDIVWYKPDGEKCEERLENSMDSLILPNCTPHSFSVPASQEFPTIFIESSTMDWGHDSYRLNRSTNNANQDSDHRGPDN